MRYVKIFMVLLWSAITIEAYSTDKEEKVDQKIAEEAKFIVAKLDSLTNSLFQQNFSFDPDAEIDTLALDSVPVLNDSVLLSRMLSIPTEMPLAYNDRVKRYIEVYSVEHRERVQQMLGMAQLYFPIFEAALDRKDMPHMLKYLPIVESALNPNAVSRAGATGLWQIMYSTGRMLDLEINSYVDERRDPYRSTEAALNYLNALHKVYGDWLLVIAAYNCGPGNLNRAIARSGGQKSFWKLMNHLPRETRGYVPAFLGAMFVMLHHEDYKLKTLNPKFSFNAVDTVHIYKRIDLSHLSKELGIEEEELAFLNPALKKHTVPPTKTGIAVKLPIHKIALYEANKDSIFKRLPDPKEELLAQSEISSSWSTPSYNYKDKTKVTYTVKPGDNLGYIAEWYDCRAQEIRNWNGIYGNTIRVGQKLTVYVPKEDYGHYDEVNKLSFKEKQSRAKSPKQAKSNAVHDEDCDCVYYKVRPGDTLWDISKKYRVSIEAIKKSNNISNSKQIKPGMVLRIQI